MDYNSKYTGEQVEDLLDKINGSPEDIATPSGEYPDMTVGKASQADTATRAINADNATNATNATTADSATTANKVDKSLKVGAKSYNGSSEVTITTADLGLETALKYHGKTSTPLYDGSTTNPIKINDKDHFQSAGCVVIYESQESGSTEFVWSGSKWEKLGEGINYKTKQTVVYDPAANGSTLTFIDTISQDTNGVITATKKSVSLATTGATGVSKLVTGDLNGKSYANGEAAAAAHTHSQYATTTALNNLVSDIEDNELVISTIVTKINDSCGFDENSESVLPNGKNLTDAIIELQNKTKDLEESDPIFTDSPAAGITGDDIENWDNKLDKDGKAVSAQTADFATDLTGRVEATPEVFTYRPSAGEKSIKDDNAFIRRVKGNSVVWNQMISTPPVSLYTNRCNLSISGNDINATVNSIEYDYVGFYYSMYAYTHPKTVNGHTYFISGLFSCPKQATVSFGVGSSQIKQLVPANTLYSYNTIQKQTSDVVGAIFTCWIEDIQVGDTFKVQNWNVIDLTQMFGAGNEPTTVEEFRALYPDSYYPYNAGELRNLDCSGIKTVGFNQWDEEWEVGQISSSTGNVLSGGNKIISKNYIPVLPNTSYFLTLPLPQDDGHGVYYYDGNKNYIGYLWIARGVNQELFTTPSNCLFIKFDSWGTTYNNDICINLHHTGWRDGEYEPYWDATKDLSIIQKYFPNGMRSAGSIYDEISFDETTQKWVAIQRVGNVDLGSLSWAYSEHLFSGETVAGFKASIEDVIFANAATSLPNITVSRYNINTADKVADGYATTETFTGYKAYKTDLYAYFTFTTDASEFKASLAGIMLNYELAEPIVTPIETPIDFNYYVEDFGTEEALLTEDSAPFSADIVYQFNATDQIRNNSRNIDKLQRSAFTPRGTSAQYIRGDGSYGNRMELSQSTPINDGEYEMPDEGDYDMQFILTPSYYAKSPRELDDTTTIAVFVTAPEDSYHLAEYWFEFAVGETLPNIEYYQPNNSEAVFRIDGDMMTYAVNILHLISSDGGETFFGEIRSYSL